VVELESVINNLCFALHNLTQFVVAMVKPIRTDVLLLLLEPVFNMQELVAVQTDAAQMQIVDLTLSARRLQGHALMHQYVEFALTSLSAALRSSDQCADVMDIPTLTYVLPVLLV